MTLNPKTILLALLLALACNPNPCRGGLASLGNVLFIGDSITDPNSHRPDGNGNYSWRYPFWKRLVENNVQHQFVGSRTFNAGGIATNYPVYLGEQFENRHEAISGTRAGERIASLAGHYNDLNQDGSNLSANTAFILLGCNDVRSVEPSLSALEEIRDQIQVLVNELQSANESVDVNLISILPRFTADTDGDGFNDLPDGRNDDYQITNGLLRQLAIDESDSNSNVNFVDIASHVRPEWFYDGIHPNSRGESQIGSLIFDAVATPEPTSLWAFSLTIMGIVFNRRRKTYSKNTAHLGT